MNSAVAAVTDGPRVHKNVNGSSLMTTVLPFRADAEETDEGMVKVKYESSSTGKSGI